MEPDSWKKGMKVNFRGWVFAFNRSCNRLDSVSRISLMGCATILRRIRTVLILLARQGRATTIARQILKSGRTILGKIRTGPILKPNGYLSIPTGATGVEKDKPNGYLSIRYWLKSMRTVPILICLLFYFFTLSLYAEKININAEISNLKSKNLNRKLSAIDKLGKARDKKATAELLKDLKTQKNFHLKSKIIESLGNTKDETVVPELESVLKTEENISVKSIAVISLGNIATENAITVLVNTVENENEETTVRLDALEGLSRIRNNEVAFNTLIKATDDKNPVIRRSAASFLWHHFYPERKEIVMPILQRMMSDSDEAVRNSIRQILE